MKPSARTSRPATLASATLPAPPPPATVDDAWKALALASGWISHAEVKAAATLGADGVLAGALLQLVQTHPVGSASGVPAVICGVLALVSAFCAVTALAPRFTAGGQVSLLYFRHIADHYGEDRPAYAMEFRSLAADADKMIGTLGGEIWANAVIAHRKFRWAQVALFAFAGALAALAMVALTTVLG